MRETVRTLNPGYFALVMATGIVSVGLGIHDRSVVSAILLCLAVGCYVVLVVLHLWRITAFRTEVRADLADPARGFGFFTFVAGSDVLGTRLALDGHTLAATALLVVAGFSWLLLGYLVPAVAAVDHGGRPPVAQADGTWFVWVVASQSVAVSAAVLYPTVTTGKTALSLLAVLAWSVGVFLYAAVGVFMLVRLALYEMHTADLSPPYWVAMGATAITVLASARILQMDDAPILSGTRDFIAGAAVLFWSFGTWLIPLLVAAGWWRHVVRRIPLRYGPAWWSIVFPLGMYSVATHTLGETEHLSPMILIGENGTWIALVAWIIAFAALLWHVGRATRRPEHAATSG